MPEPLLPRVARGESAAVDACIERYGGLVWSLSCRLSPEDADDASQEIFIDLWRNAWRFREGVGTEVAFVSTLARRRLIDRRRRSGRTVQAESLGELDVASRAATPIVELESAETLDRIKRCLEALKPRDREVVELSVYDGLSQSTIAERLGAPLGTVKTLVRRALIRLRDCVGSPRRTAAVEAVHE